VAGRGRGGKDDGLVFVDAEAGDLREGTNEAEGGVDVLDVVRGGDGEVIGEGKSA
jgi:hypothetical protein